MKRISLVMLLLVGLTTISYGQKKRAEPGYYIDNLGNKIEGMFVYHKFVRREDGSVSRSYLTYYENDKKVDDFYADEIEGFVLGEDSLTGIAYFYSLKKRTEFYDFAKQIQAGAIELYSIPMYSRIQQGDGSTAVTGQILAFGKAGSNEFYSFSFPKKGKAAFLSLISDHTELAKEAEEIGSWGFIAHIEDFVTRYNDWALENK